MLRGSGIGALRVTDCRILELIDRGYMRLAYILIRQQADDALNVARVQRL